MKLKFYKPDELYRNLKATIHKTGKLGFTAEAAKVLELTRDKKANIAFNEDDANDTSLYLIITGDVDDHAFSISLAGDYYYINTKALFDTLKIDYSKETVVYDITVETMGGDKVFKLKRREKSKKAIENN